VGDTSGNIYALNPSSGASTLLVDIGDYVNALAVAPEGYGSLEGQLLVAVRSGELVAVNTASAATTVVTDTGGTLSDIEFASDGTLYAVDYDYTEVITISSDGMTSTVASGFNAPDGIAVDEDGGRLLVSDCGGDTLYGVQISDGARTDLGSYDFDGGWYPSGLAFDGVETLLIATGEDHLTIQALTF
jgi:DNA-binding beta-propeller fold protein YncE